MALASCQEANSPVELSLSPVYHYQFSSIAKSVDKLSSDKLPLTEFRKVIQAFCMRYFDRSGSPGYYLLQTDTTPVCKPHSPTLEGRTYIAVPNNVIAGNKPLSIGYEVSYINISDAQSSWSLPLSVRRVSVDQTASECALEQLKELFAHPELNFLEELVINTLDSKYGNAYYLAPAHQHLQLVNVVRLRSGMKVFKYQPRANTGGAPGVYGEKYYLRFESKTMEYKSHPRTGQPYEVHQRALLELAPDQKQEIETTTRKGRKLKVTIFHYNDMMIRSKDGNNMKDKPFDVLAVQVKDAKTGEKVFDKEMFIAVCGERKAELSPENTYKFYRRRYDIEPSLRFNKQRLMLTNYQTPDVEHLDNWLLINQLTNWLLYTASDEANLQVQKWEQYLPQNKQTEDAPRLSIAQVRKSAQALFLTFEQSPFEPKKSKKGKGRQNGQTQPPRERYKVVKKTTGKKKPKHQEQQIE